MVISGQQCCNCRLAYWGRLNWCWDSLPLGWDMGFYRSGHWGYGANCISSLCRYPISRHSWTKLTQISSHWNEKEDILFLLTIGVNSRSLIVCSGPRRASVGGMCYHVLNRGNGRGQMFHKAGDSAAFLDLMAALSRRVAVPAAFPRSPRQNFPRQVRRERASAVQARAESGCSRRLKLLVSC